MKIDLRIERLVLYGMPLTPAQRHVLSASFETELVRLVSAAASNGTLPSGGATPQVPAPEIQIARPLDPARTGSRIARAVFQGLGSLGPAGDGDER